MKNHWSGASHLYMVYARPLKYRCTLMPVIGQTSYEDLRVSPLKEYALLQVFYALWLIFISCSA